MPLTIASTNLVSLTGLTDTTDGTLPTTAVVTVTVLDSTGVAITGATSISMPYVAATPGFVAAYRGAIPSTVTLPAGSCTLRITATDGANVRRFDIADTIAA